MSLGQIVSALQIRSNVTYVSRSLIDGAFTQSLNMLLPPLCGICDIIIDVPGLCVSCFQKLRPISEPWCNICGRPLTVSLPHDLCGACLTAPPPLRAIRSAYQYNDASRALLLPFKHAGQIQIAATIAPLMRQAFSTLASDGHIVIPIPLHWRRLVHRRYNQSAEIARRLCGFSARGKAMAPHFAPQFLKNVSKQPLCCVVRLPCNDIRK